MAVVAIEWKLLALTTAVSQIRRRVKRYKYALILDVMEYILRVAFTACT